MTLPFAFYCHTSADVHRVLSALYAQGYTWAVESDNPWYPPPGVDEQYVVLRMHEDRPTLFLRRTRPSYTVYSHTQVDTILGPLFPTSLLWF